VEGASAKEIERAARVHGWTVAKVLANPRRFDCVDPLAAGFLIAHRDEVTPGLIEIAARSGPEDRMWLGDMLLDMGEPAGGSLLLEPLVARDRRLAPHALAALSRLFGDSGERRRAALDPAAARAAVRPFVRDPESHLRKTAAQIICRLAEPDDLAEVRSLLASDDLVVRGEAAKYLCAEHADAAAWPVLAALFESAPGDTYFLILSLDGFVRSPDAALRRDVADFICASMERLAEQPGYEAANHVWNLVKLLEDLDPARYAPMLEFMTTSKIEPWMRAAAGERLAELQSDAPPNWETVVAGLEDSRRVDWALKTIASHPAPVGSPALADRLFALFTERQWNDRNTAIATALVATGLWNDARLDAVLPSLDEWRQFDLRSRRLGFDGEALLARLQAAGVAVGASERDAFLDEWRGPDRGQALLGVLSASGRLQAFDCEDVESPPRYADMIASLSELTADAYRWGEVAFAAAPEGELALEVRADDVTEVIPLRDFGSWYDLDGLLAGLNRLLVRLGSTLQYYLVTTPGQVGVALLAQASVAPSLATEFGAPLITPQTVRASQAD
jgi:hypothetical protein